MEKGRWIDFGKTWREFGNGYSKSDRSVPGVQIEMENGNRYLIGDINEIGGICDDCKGVRDTEVIVRYRYLLTEEDLES